MYIHYMIKEAFYKKLIQRAKFKAQDLGAAFTIGKRRPFKERMKNVKSDLKGGAIGVGITGLLGSGYIVKNSHDIRGIS